MKVSSLFFFAGLLALVCMMVLGATAPRGVGAQWCVLGIGALSALSFVCASWCEWANVR